MSREDYCIIEAAFPTAPVPTILRIREALKNCENHAECETQVAQAAAMSAPQFQRCPRTGEAQCKCGAPHDCALKIS
jgi:hypothetical protein